ncbi:MAG: hypothetical protein GEU80_02520 [Dehalococcoidia bacterium]|nr:hypothetical protein [Dehalococcoidia bacterium]
MGQMYGDNGIVLDLDSVAHAIAEADVLVVGFEMCAQRLLVDLRPDGHTPPLIEIVEPLASAQDRYVWLSARRPALSPPERFVFFVWPHSVEFLRRSPVPQGVADRIRREQGVEVGGDLVRVMDDLHSREKDEVVGAIFGTEGYETLWSRDGS